MSLAEQDAYTPPRDGIAIVSPSVNEKVAVRRGGYFILPQVGQAYLEEGSIQVRQAIDRQYHSMFVAFSLRRPRQGLPADRYCQGQDICLPRGVERSQA
jgi:hypothetical protein